MQEAKQAMCLGSMDVPSIQALLFPEQGEHHRLSETARNTTDQNSRMKFRQLG